MLEQLGISNGRQVFYFSINEGKDLFNMLPDSGWLLFVIIEDIDFNNYKVFCRKCLEKSVTFVCAVGKACELAHDTFDEEILAHKIEKGESINEVNDFINAPLTTWHNNFSEGFWFSITSAYHDTIGIDKIVCVDFTLKGVKKHLSEILKKTNDRWLPSDEEFEQLVFDD